MISAVNKQGQSIRFSGPSNNTNFKKQIDGKKDKVDVDQQLGDDIFNTAVEKEEAEMKKYEELENENAPLAQKKSLLTDLHRFITNSKATIERLLSDSKREKESNSRLKRVEEQAAEKSQRSIDCSEISKMEPQFAQKEKALQYFDRNIASRRNSLDMHREKVDMLDTLNNRHDTAIASYHNHVDRLKKDANTVDLRLKAVEQSKHVDEAIDTMSRYNRVVRESYLDTSQDIRQLDQRLSQLQLLERSSEEDTYKRHLEKLMQNLRR